MKFKGTGNFEIISEKDFPEKIKLIEQQLLDCRKDGCFESFDSKKIYYEYFLAENSIGSVIIVHGLSEFTKKFYEMAYYFLSKGYNVFLYDQRCHGLSERLTEDKDLIHVDSFDDYVADLDCYIEKIVLSAADKPLYIYAHSMGGAVALKYLAKETVQVKKAVLSSPLIKPKTANYPTFLALVSLKLSMLFLGKADKFKYSGSFNPNYPHTKSQDSSENRFNYNMALRVNEPMYQSTPYTLCWAYCALRLEREFINKKFTDRIHTPVLILSAEKDTVVSNSSQSKFAEKCELCRIKTMKNSKHSVYSSNSSTIELFMNEVFSFYED